MTYFDCFVIGSWMFALGWFLGAIYAQNQDEETQIVRMGGEAEPCPDCEAWRLPALASASAD